MTLRAANPPIAIAFMLTATAFIAATMLLAKSLGTATLGPPLHPLQISHGRFLFAFLAIGSMAAVLRPKIAQPHLGLHIGRTRRAVALVCGLHGADWRADPAAARA